MRGSALLLALPLLVLPGCRMNERMTGTIGGAVGGGLLGVAVGAGAGGVLLAAAGGAVIGYVVGDYLSDQQERGGCAPPPCGSCSVPSPCEVYPGSFAQTLPSTSAPSAQCPSAQYRSAELPSARAPTYAASASGNLAAARAAYERGRTATTTEEATAAYQHSIRLDPTRPEPWNALALQALVAGDRSSARSHLSTSLALDPAYGPARHNLERLDRGL